jgi:hypothetical protein
MALSTLTAARALAAPLLARSICSSAACASPRHGEAAGRGTMRCEVGRGLGRSGRGPREHSPRAQRHSAQKAQAHPHCTPACFMTSLLSCNSLLTTLMPQEGYGTAAAWVSGRPKLGERAAATAQPRAVPQLQLPCYASPTHTSGSLDACAADFFACRSVPWGDGAAPCGPLQRLLAQPRARRATA